MVITDLLPVANEEIIPPETPLTARIIELIQDEWLSVVGTPSRVSKDRIDAVVLGPIRYTPELEDLEEQEPSRYKAYFKSLLEAAAQKLGYDSGIKFWTKVRNNPSPLISSTFDGNTNQGSIKLDYDGIPAKVRFVTNLGQPSYSIGAGHFHVSTQVNQDRQIFVGSLFSGLARHRKYEVTFEQNGR